MLYVVENTQQAKRLSRLCKANKIRRVCHGVYTDDFKSALETIVLRNWLAILPHIVSHGILAYRTAIDLKPLPFRGQSIVFVISSYIKTINLPGLIIKVYKGNNSQFLEHVLPGLSRSNTARRLLENLTTVRGADYKGIKTIGINGVEKLLAKALRLHGEVHLNNIRDEAKYIAENLGFEKEYQKINRIISALLLTRTDKDLLTTSYAKAVAEQKPYDDNRIKLFDELIAYLKECNFLKRKYTYRRNSFKNLSFYEAYFSNFIEGTEFIIDDAEDIAFKGIEIANRHADSHDVLSSFTIANDYSEMSLTPKNSAEFIDILQNRHAILMKERPEKHPGKFKEKPNRAGNTTFVAPEDALGTLYQGFERYQVLNSGLEKALFMHFLISEVHPFADGNGRLARLMMNAELVSNVSFKIIIPSVHRDNYLNGLRLASRDGNFMTYIKVMDQAHAYTASINWDDYGEARAKIEADNANLSSDEGTPVFNRALRQLNLSDIAA